MTGDLIEGTSQLGRLQQTAVRKQKYFMRDRIEEFDN
jgi:hypothetical protein